MKSTVAVNGGPSSVWSTVSSWLFSSVSLSIAAPIFLYRVYGYVRQSRRTDTLPDKVSCRGLVEYVIIIIYLWNRTIIIRRSISHI